MPYDLSPGAMAFMALAFLVAAFVRGYSGFGFSALVVAASGVVTNPLNFVAVVMICEFLMTFQLIGPAMARVSWWRVVTLMLGAMVGVPLGLWALTGIGAEAARAVVAIYVLVMCAALLAGWTLRAEAGRVAHVGAGLISGLANAAGMGGLPVAVFFAAQPIAAAVFRATLIAYFAALDIFTLPVMWGHGLVTRDTLIVTAASLPVVGLGVWLGGRHFLRTEPQSFRRFAIYLLAGLALMGLARSLL
ncbi:sulfite exporter TauE/SafE family protein [Fertoebacter nigrum]|uniref:Probable membrane transporter protein n=1 Tax=Fertoeibacter niger TaxID=2656921 RepID=A0A8X8GZ02_9RHOB|nr:TSUP family transporter [Fertoeibacter niger]NUB43810.1 sulfite exporter TauE/SafE family protein [Fertoeibacter niger]